MHSIFEYALILFLFYIYNERISNHEKSQICLYCLLESISTILHMTHLRPIVFWSLGFNED